VDTFKGKKLKDVKYKPLFTFLPPDKPAHYVMLGDFVTTEDGTGLVHIKLLPSVRKIWNGKQHDLPDHADRSARWHIHPEITPWRGIFVKDADPLIIKDLEARGLLFRAGTITHTYPFCWRCGLRFVLRARVLVHPHQRVSDRLLS
jgi:isoleucyl-tRNA synthetase